jgi:regulatory protein
MSQRKYNQEMTRLMIRAWCDKAERAHQDVKTKLFAWGVPQEERDELVAELIELNLLNEERFASAFAHDKSEFNQWGRLKIEHALRKKGVSDRNIRHALLLIPQEDQTDTINDIIRKRLPKLKGKPEFQKKGLLARYLISKGFENDQIWKQLENLKSSE